MEEIKKNEFSGEELERASGGRYGMPKPPHQVNCPHRGNYQLVPFMFKGSRRCGFCNKQFDV